jgi:hypothetical protein
MLVSACFTNCDGAHLFIVTIRVGNHLRKMGVGFREQVLVVLEVGFILVVCSGGLVHIGNKRTNSFSMVSFTQRDWLAVSRQ